MDTATIVTASGNNALIKKLRAVLVENGYKILGHAADGNDCIRKLRSLKPDIAVLDYDLPPQNGFEVAKIAVEDKLCGVVLMASYERKNIIDSLAKSYDCLVVGRPLGRESFVAAVDFIVKSRKRIIELEKEIEDLKETLETRKEIEKAKGLLMKHLNISEDQAFRMIQKRSMDKGIKMSEIAKAINLAYTLKED